MADVISVLALGLHEGWLHLHWRVADLINSMGKALLFLQVEINTSVNLRVVRTMDKVPIPMKVAINTSVDSSMVTTMDKVPTPPQMEAY